jgi:lysyl endopeptidase
MKWPLICVAAWLAVASSWASPLPVVASVDTVRVDLNPLIDAAAHSPEQFAVSVPHSFSSTSEGTWFARGSTRTWVYTVRIPTAISMSFHAGAAILPPSAVLAVSAGRTTFRYTARDVARSGLWGRPIPGDTLAFSLSVDSSEANRVHLQIDHLEAGYRSLGGGVANHPHYQELIKGAASTSGSCTANYSCYVSPSNQGPSHATVALIIGNLYQCTGTLLTDTRSDGVPYILTARHCEIGQLGGGNPDAAANVSVYWDAVSPCNGQLGSIYDSTTLTQTGATTALEQQDIWLLQLDTPPAASDAYYAGWDATGSGFSGGYTIHHALGLDQQYVEWSGPDLLVQIPGTTLSVAYASTFWGVVNGVGNVGAGASGSALFSPDNLVVGSASLAALVNGENSAGVCPVTPPPTPSPNSVTALFTALSGVWTSSADRTTSTPGKTLKMFLDPGNTGHMTTSGLATQPITVTASSTFANSGDAVTLTWNAAGAQSCTAWGGTAGDGWAGAVAASGSVTLTSQVGGSVAYSLSCVVGNQIGAGTVTVTWNYIQPVTNLSGGSAGPFVLGATTAFNWLANVGPCLASGGTPGDGWAGAKPTSGSFELTVTAIGVTGYTLTCGSGQRTAANSLYVDGVPPVIYLVSDVSQITAGSTLELSWFGNGTGAPCVPSGGSATDGWATNSAGIDMNGSSLLSEANAGTYTYTLTCTSGGQITSSSQTVVVTSGPPAISLLAASPQQQVSTGPNPNLLWTTTVGNCFFSYHTNSGLSTGGSLLGIGSSGVWSDVEASTGLVTYTLQCGSLSATATIDWIATAVPNALSATDTTWAANVAYPVTWNSTVGPCTASGGGAADGWAGSKGQSGSQMLSESQPGGYQFTLVCGLGASALTSQLIIDVPLPHIQIYSTPQPSGTLTETLITWQSSVGPCTYLDGSASNSAGVPVASNGSATPAPAVAGTYLFSLTCGTGADALFAATLAYVNVNAPTTLVASASATEVDAPVTLTWSSAGGICYATGGDGNAPWIGTLPGSGSGSLIVTSTYVGALTYGINCNSELAQAVVNYVAAPATSTNGVSPGVMLSASASTLTADQSFTLTWSSKNADSCVASGGDAGDGWNGTLAPSGSMSVTESSPGSVTYSISCAGAPPAATASATVVIKSAQSVTVTGSSHGGGGAIDLVLLLGLGIPLVVRLTRESNRGMKLGGRNALNIQS